MATLAIVALLAAALAVTASVVDSRPSHALGGGAAPVVYVANSEGGSLGSLTVGASAPGPAIPVGDAPQSVAITPDASTALVTKPGTGIVSVVTLATGAHRDISVGSGVTSQPQGIAVTADGTTAWVVNMGDNTVQSIDLATGNTGTPIMVGLQPSGIAISPDGFTLYVSDTGSASVTVVNLHTMATASIPVGLDPQGIAIQPDGSTVYVTNAGTSSVTPIQTARKTPGLPIAVGSKPIAIAISPDGSTAYVANSGDGTVSVVDLNSNTQTSTITMPTDSSGNRFTPTGVAVTPDGDTAFVSSLAAGAVVGVDLTTESVSSTVTGFSGPLGLAVTPDQAPLAQLSVSGTSINAGAAVTFDASASTVVYGTIVNYTWFFGDGSPFISGASATSVTHTYTTPGRYTAGVVETDSAGTSWEMSFTGQTVSRNVPLRNGVPQSEAAVSIQVAGQAIPTNTPALYVANAGSNSVSTSPAFPFVAGTTGSSVPVGTTPGFIAVTGNGIGSVVTDTGANNATPIVACPQANGTVDFMAGAPVVTGAKPLGVAIAPAPVSLSGTSSTWTVLVANSGSNNVSRFQLTVNAPVGGPCTATLSASSTQLGSFAIPVGGNPYQIAITPDGSTAYVTNVADAAVTPINLSTNVPGTPIPVGVQPWGIAVTPDGSSAYVVSGASGTVTPISTSTNAPRAPISLGTSVSTFPLTVTGPNPYQIAITPDGTRAYVTDTGTHQVSVIDLAKKSVTATINMPFKFTPTAISVNPDGSTVYVSAYGVNRVVPIAVANNSAGAPVPGFSNPNGLAVTPDLAPTASLTVSATSVSLNTPVTFDATGSSAYFGRIVQYQYTFGDGTSQTKNVTTSCNNTCAGTTTHSYATAGPIRAFVTVTDSAGTSWQPSFTGQTASRYIPVVNGLPQSIAAVRLTVSAGAITPGMPLLYVPNSASTSVVPVGIPNGASPVPGAPITVGNAPQFMATTPDGTAAVVSNYGSNSVTPIAACPDGAGGMRFAAGTPAFIAAGAKPEGVAISPVPLSTSASSTTWAVYVADSGGNSVSHFVLRVTPTAGSCTASLSAAAPASAFIIPVGSTPYDIVVTPDGSTAYVTNTGDNTVTPITLSTNQAGAPIPAGASPHGLAISPRGDMLYVVASAANAVTPVSISGPAPVVGTPISVGKTPYWIAIAPDGSNAWVTNTGETTVSTFPLTNNPTATKVSLLDIPSGVAVSPDSSTVYVSSMSGGSIFPIDNTTKTRGKPITGGFRQPLGIATSVGGS